jgi:hypothetical protein
MSIIEGETLKRLGKQLKEKRNRKQEYITTPPIKKRNLFGDDDDYPQKNIFADVGENVHVRKNLFDDDDISGGTKRRPRKTIKKRTKTLKKRKTARRRKCRR